MQKCETVFSLMIFSLKFSFISTDFGACICVFNITGLSGVYTSPGCSGVLPEASSQPLSHTVPQCTAAPQRLRPGLLRNGPQHPATLWYAHTHTRMLNNMHKDMLN